MNEPELDDLFVRFRDGHDPRALAQLFDRTAPRLLALATRLVREPADAEDLVQTTFLAAIAARHGFDANRPILGWLVGILQKQAVELHRKASRTAPGPIRDESTVDEPVSVVLADEEKAHLRTAIAELPPRDRELIDLAVGSSLGPLEISRRLGRTPGAIRVQMFRAIERLRELMPAGLTASAFLLALESQCLAAVRARTMARVPNATFAAAGAITAWKLVAALFFACGVGLIGFVTMKRGDGDSITARDDASRSTPGMPPRVVAAQSEPPAIVEPQRDAVPSTPPAAATSSVVRLSVSVTEDGVGIDLDEAMIVPAREGDLVLSGRELRCGPGLAIGNLSREWFCGPDRPLSDDAMTRALERIDPPLLSWSDAANLTLYESGRRTFVVRRDDRYLAFGITTQRRDESGGRHFDLAWREIRGDFVSPTPPPGMYRVPIEFDAAIVERDEFAAALEAKKRAYLAQLDAHVDFIAKSVAPIEGFVTRGCAFREHAATVTMDDHFDYVSSTYSFVHDTRDDVKKTWNSWSIEFEWYEGHGTADNHLTTGDAGDIFDLGPRDPSAFDATWVRDAPRLDRNRPLREGSLYLVETLEPQRPWMGLTGQRLDLIRIVSLRPTRDVVFQWREITDARVASSIRSELPPLEGCAALWLKDGNCVVQMRVGDAGVAPYQAFLDGRIKHIDERSLEPLDLSGPIDTYEECRVHVEGGRVPEGKLWRITEIEWFATTEGGTKGPGGFRIAIREETIANVETSDRESRGTWRGEITLEPADGRQSYVEIKNASRCDVRIRGTLIDAPSK